MTVGKLDGVGTRYGRSLIVVGGTLLFGLTIAAGTASQGPGPGAPRAGAGAASNATDMWIATTAGNWQTPAMGQDRGLGNARESSVFHPTQWRRLEQVPLIPHARGAGSSQASNAASATRAATQRSSGAAANGSTLPPFQEAHWQGLELVPLTKALARFLDIKSDVRGVCIDDVTAPADMAGFLAGDVVTAVGRTRTPDLCAFIEATDMVRDSGDAEVWVVRNGKELSLELAALQGRLGVANGETAPMIKSGSQPPHGYKGPCTSCHRIGTTGQLAVDPGDTLSRRAPPIRAGQPAPHQDRGTCTSCHEIVP